MKPLYHISFDPVEALIPRVPEHRAPGEDAETPRICFSETIEDAITAMPKGGQALRGMLKCRHKITPILYAYIADREADREAYLCPYDIYIKHHVHDAIANKEWWAIKPVTVQIRTLRVENAFFRDAKDELGNAGAIVLQVDFADLTEYPENAPVRFFGSRGVKHPLRTVFALADQKLEEYAP